MLQGSITVAIILWLSSLLIGGIMLGVFIWASKHKEPMPFWTGSSMRADEFTDVAAYNRANILMWLVYTFCMALSGVLSLFSILAGLIALGVLFFPGAIILIKVNKKIFYKYKSEKGTYRIEI